MGGQLKDEETTPEAGGGGARRRGYYLSSLRSSSLRDLLVLRKIGHLARECWHKYGQSSSLVNMVVDIEIDIETEQEELKVAFTEFQDSLDTIEKWYMNSGASHHVTGERNHLDTMTSPIGRKTVTTADGERHAIVVM